MISYMRVFWFDFLRVFDTKRVESSTTIQEHTPQPRQLQGAREV